LKRINELVEKGEILGEDETKQKLDAAQRAIENVRKELESESLDGYGSAEELANHILSKFNKALADLNEVEERGYWNSQKAKSILLKAQIYDLIAVKIKEKFFKDRKEEKSGEKENQELSGEEEQGGADSKSSDSEEDGNNSNIRDSGSGIFLFASLEVGNRIVNNNNQVLRVVSKVQDPQDPTKLIFKLYNEHAKEMQKEYIAKSETLEEYGYSLV